jgi:hypothetical protein
VAALAAARIYPMGETPQEPTRPYIIFGETGLSEGMGDTQKKDKLRSNSVEIMCVTESYTAACILAKAVVTALEGYSGTDAALGETIAGCFVTDQHDETMRHAAEGESPLHAATISCTVWHYC